MTTWEVLQRLMLGANIYWRKFFIFLILVVTVSSGYLLWNHQKRTLASSAVANPTSSNEGYVDNETLDVVVSDNGQVLTPTKNISDSLKILPGKYEISIIALDSPGVEIGDFKAEIHLPASATQSQISQRVYAVHGVGSNQAYLSDPQTLVYEASDIDTGATLTLVADLPLNILNPPLTKKVGYFLSQIPAQTYAVMAIILPIITYIILILMVVRRRQDQFFYTSKKIISLPPSNSPPAVVGALMDGRVGSREIAATLIDLATRGYLFINQHENGTFSFGKRKSLNLETLPELHEYERILLSKIFEPDQYKSTDEDVQARIGRHIFSKKIAQVYLNIYDEAIKLGYFVKNPVTIHLYWRYTGIVFLFMSFLGFGYTAIWGADPKYLLFSWASQMVAAAVIIKISDMMPVRSVVGTTTLRQWLQFKKYLELDQSIEGGAVLSETFNKMLPYAIVFGIEAEWTKRFMNENYTKPDWYESDLPVITLENFVGELFPIISYVGDSLDKSHEPTVE
jgi:hypothetical protein